MNQDERRILQSWGWSAHFDSVFAALGEPSLAPARVVSDYGARFRVEAGSGSHDAAPVGELAHRDERLAIGDWIAIDQGAEPAAIRHLLPRLTAIKRKTPDQRSTEQVLAANVDLFFLAMALGGDVNLRRIERMLTAAYQSGATPVIILTKTDIEDPSPYIPEIGAIAPGVPVISISAIRGEGVDEVQSLLPEGKTGVLIGSSGVGKSTLVNRLLAVDVLATGGVHSSGQGRHTTTRRELVRIPGAGMLIDTPGLREMQLWAGSEALDQTFADIEALASECRFRNCEHNEEPGCAVLAALETGQLQAARFSSYRKLQRELRAIEVRADARLRSEERRKWRLIHKAAGERMKTKRGLR